MVKNKPNRPLNQSFQKDAPVFDTQLLTISLLHHDKRLTGHQTQGSDGLGPVSPAQLLLETARPLSGAEGLRASPEIAVHSPGHRRSGAEVGHREADGSVRARAPLHARHRNSTPKIGGLNGAPFWG